MTAQSAFGVMPSPDLVAANRLRRRPGWAATGILCLLAAGWLALAACSRPPELPQRYFGLAFGDAPPADLLRQSVPLPEAVSGKLAYFTAPGRRATLWDTVLVEPILAFYQGRFFSVDAILDDATGVSGLETRLTREFGPPHCRESAGQKTCLWQVGEVELILENGSRGPARLMVRHEPTAAAVAAVFPREADNRLGERSLGPVDAGDER